jgi:hypothetical protein
MKYHFTYILLTNLKKIVNDSHGRYIILEKAFQLLCSVKLLRFFFSFSVDIALYK